MTLNGKVEHIDFRRRFVLVHVACRGYFVLRVKDTRGLTVGDELCGAFATPGVTGWLNLTRRLLLKGPIVGSGESARSALTVAAQWRAAPPAASRKRRAMRGIQGFGAPANVVAIAS